MKGKREPEGHEWPEGSAHADKLMGVVDFYQVNDWRYLDSLLASRDNVTGNLEVGWTWHGDTTAGKGEIAELEADGDQLIVETSSESAAEDARSWLESLERSPVAFTIGQVWYGPAGSP